MYNRLIQNKKVWSGRLGSLGKMLAACSLELTGQNSKNKQQIKHIFNIFYLFFTLYFKNNTHIKKDEASLALPALHISCYEDDA